MRPLTLKQDKFRLRYVDNDGNGLKAARYAGYKGNDNVLAAIASQNLRKLNIKQKIEQYKTELRAESEHTFEQGTSKLQHAYDVAESLNQPAVMVSSTVSLNRMHGWDKDAGTKTQPVFKLPEAESEALTDLARAYKVKLARTGTDATKGAKHA